MQVGDVLEVMREAIWLTLVISAPFLLITLVVGLIISVIQAMTQLQEATLTFVPKTVLVFGALLLFGPALIQRLIDFTVQLMDRAISLGVQ